MEEQPSYCFPADLQSVLAKYSQTDRPRPAVECVQVISNLSGKLRGDGDEDGGAVSLFIRKVTP